MVNDEAVCCGSGATSYHQETCTAAVELDVGDVVNVKALAHDAVLFGGSAGKINRFAAFCTWPYKEWHNLQ